MNASTAKPAFPQKAAEGTGRTIGVSGRLSMRGLAEVLEAMLSAPGDVPLRLDVRRAKLDAQTWLALAHAVWLTRKPKLRLEGGRGPRASFSS